MPQNEEDIGGRWRALQLGTCREGILGKRICCSKLECEFGIESREVRAGSLESEEEKPQSWGKEFEVHVAVARWGSDLFFAYR